MTYLISACDTTFLILNICAFDINMMLCIILYFCCLILRFPTLEFLDCMIFLVNTLVQIVIKHTLKGQTNHLKLLYNANTVQI